MGTRPILPSKGRQVSPGNVSDEIFLLFVPPYVNGGRLLSDCFVDLGFAVGYTSAPCHRNEHGDRNKTRKSSPGQPKSSLF